MEISVGIAGSTFCLLTANAAPKGDCPEYPYGTNGFLPGYESPKPARAEWPYRATFPPAWAIVFMALQSQYVGERF